MTRRPNPLDPDEIQMEAIGELISEYMDDHPEATETEAYDAVCFDVLRRAETIHASRISALLDKWEHI